MSILADITIAALRRNHDDLAALVPGFDEADLARTSGAVDWTVGQVLSHLGSGAEIALAGLKAGLAGVDAPGLQANQLVWDRWNAMVPADQAGGFLRANAELVAAFEGLDPPTREHLRVKLGFLPFPADLAVIAGMRLNEAALHGWDVRVTFDPRATVGPQEAGAAIDQLAGPLGFLLGFIGRPMLLGGVQGTLRVETTDPDRVLGVVLGDTIGVVSEPAAADGTLRLPAEAWLRLVTGRLGEAHTPDTVGLTGDLITLEQLRQVFPGF